jgi:hypothetical protein
VAGVDGILLASVGLILWGMFAWNGGALIWGHSGNVVALFVIGMLAAGCADLILAKEMGRVERELDHTVDKAQTALTNFLYPR